MIQVIPVLAPLPYAGCMPSCPLCHEQLETVTEEGWLCRCGETIAFGFEKEDAEDCGNCKVLQCPKRR